MARTFANVPIQTWMDPHRLCPRVSTGGHARFEVRQLSGERFPLRHMSNRICTNTSVAYLLRRMPEECDWPNNYISLFFGDRYFGSTRTSETVFLVDLRLQQIAEGCMEPDDPLVLYIHLHPIPDMFWTCFGCVCDFTGHGCCRSGRLDELQTHCWESLQWGDDGWWHRDCWWCGNCRPCREGECSHRCCLTATRNKKCAARSAAACHPSGRRGQTQEPGHAQNSTEHQWGSP